MRAVRVMSSRRRAGKDNSREPYKRYYWYSVAKCSILPVDLINRYYHSSEPGFQDGGQCAAGRGAGLCAGAGRVLRYGHHLLPAWHRHRALHSRREVMAVSDYLFNRQRLVQQMAQLFKRGTGAVFAQHEHLGGNAERDLVRRLRAEIEADGRVNLRQPLAGNALVVEVAENLFNLAGAADHAHIVRVRLQRRLERVFVEVMAARDNDDPAGLVRHQGAQRLRNIAKGKLHVVAECLRVGEVAAIIDDHDAKIKLGGQSGQGLSNVARACDNQTRLRVQHLDKNLKRRAATADGEVAIQMDMG